MSAVYNTNNQQMGLYYDANGNQAWDSQHATQYGWNVENRLVTETSQAWPGPTTFFSYDPWGHRVMQDVNPDPAGQEGSGYEEGAWTFYFYDIYGRKLQDDDGELDRLRVHGADVRPERLFREEADHDQRELRGYR